MLSTCAPIKVLHITIGDGNYGGVASFLYNYYSYIDHSKVHFDFLYCGKNSMKPKQDSLVLSDSKITELNILKSNNNGFKEYKQLILVLNKLFDKEQYDIVHVNSSNPYVNYCVAKSLKGRSVYISHSHNTQSTVIYGSKIKHIIKTILKRHIQKYIVKKADALYACSKEAGINLFGKKGIQTKKFSIINNAIDVSKCSFDPIAREKLKTDDKLIVGFVGRLADQKNPIFAIDVFHKIHSINKNSEMWIVGDGELRSVVKMHIESNGLNKWIKLFGQRDDVSSLMQAMDLLLMPSVYEGLGIVAIEAQCSGLLVFASDCVPKSANITGLVTYLSLSKSTDEWARNIISGIKTADRRNNRSEQVKMANYDIAVEAKKLEKRYFRLLSKSKKG